MKTGLDTTQYEEDTRSMTPQTPSSELDLLESLAKEFIIGYKKITKTQRKLIEQKEMADNNIDKLNIELKFMKKLKQEIIDAMK